MSISASVVRDLGDSLNTNFNAAQAAILLTLANAAKDEATASIPAPSALPDPPSADGDYVLKVASGVVTWVAAPAE